MLLLPARNFLLDETSINLYAKRNNENFTTLIFSGGMMRKLLNTTAILLLISFLLMGSSFAGEKKIPNSNLDYDKVEQTLIMGLDSDNFGLKVSSAYMLGEIKSEKAVNRLTKLLRDANDERMRLAAALSLIKIGSEKSVYFVKQGQKFNDLEKIRDMCVHLYKAHVATTFNGVEPDSATLYSYISNTQ